MLVEDGRDLISLKELIGEEWYGSCVSDIKHSFIGTSKTITFVVMRGLAAKIKSFFDDDYSDEDYHWI